MPFFDKSMNQKDKSGCDCILFDGTSPSHQNEKFFLNKRTKKYQLSNQVSKNINKVYQKRRQKYSLKLPKGKQEKENNCNTLSDYYGFLDPTLQKTEVMTRADSQKLRTNHDYHQTKPNSCFSSYLFNYPIYKESKNGYGRLMIENQKNEQKLCHENYEKETILKQKTNSEVKAELSGQTSNRYNNQNLNLLQNTLKIKGQINRHTRSESGEIICIPNFYSEKYMKASIKDIQEKQISSIVFKKKTKKRISYFQEMHIRDTQSINDSSSEAFSEVISQFNENGAQKDQFSQVIVTKSKQMNSSAMPKFSKFK